MTAPVLKSLRPGDILFHEGTTPYSIYILRKGTIAVRKRKGAAQVEMARIYSGEVLGELSFFDGAPRSASAVALTEVEVLEVSFDNLKKIYATVPDYFKTIIAALAERLRKAGDQIQKLKSQTVETTEMEELEDKEEVSDATSALTSASLLTGEDGKD